MLPFTVYGLLVAYSIILVWEIIGFIIRLWEGID